MTLEGAQGRIWCSEFSLQTVSCSWSIDGEAALTKAKQSKAKQRCVMGVGMCLYMPS